MIEMQEVTSSQIARVGYDVDSAALFIDFKPKGSYRYENVAPELYEELMKAESVGKFFNVHIKGHSTYPYQRIEEARELLVPVEPPPALDPDTIGQSALTVSEQAKAIVITTAADYTRAAEMLKAVVDMRRSVEDTFKPMKDAAHKAHKAVCEQETKILAPVIEAERYLRSGIGAHQAEEARQRRAEEERIRLQNQRQAEADAQRRSEDAALEDAAVAHQNGDSELAEQILSSPLPMTPAKVAPVVLPSSVPKVAGVSARAVWKWRITDANLIPRQYLIPDEAAIGQVARALKDRANIPGVEIYNEAAVTVGSRR